jgi:hypothetical protein
MRGTTTSDEIVVSEKKGERKKTPNSIFLLNFLCGTLASMTATSIIQPIDMVKVRI